MADDKAQVRGEDLDKTRAGYLEAFIGGLTKGLRLRLSHDENNRRWEIEHESRPEKWNTIFMVTEEAMTDSICKGTTLFEYGGKALAEQILGLLKMKPVDVQIPTKRLGPVDKRAGHYEMEHDRDG